MTHPTAERVGVLGWQPIETMKVWDAAIVADGERVAMAQLALDDDGEHYWSVDPEDALDWEPTHWIDPPDLARAYVALAERVRELECERGETREVFLGMIADARRYETEYDDETGGSVSYHLHVGGGFEELAEALGVKPPGYMEGWPDAINRAVALSRRER